MMFHRSAWACQFDDCPALVKLTMPAGGEIMGGMVPTIVGDARPWICRGFMPSEEWAGPLRLEMARVKAKPTGPPG